MLLGNKNNNPFFHIGQKALNTVKTIGQKVNQCFQHPVNTLLGIDDSNKLLKGEMHGILKLKDGTFQNARFMGAGTAIHERYRQDGLSEVDKISKAHDLRFELLDEGKNIQEQIREADNKFLKKLDHARKNKLDNDFNLNQAELIRLKTKIEDTAKPIHNFITEFHTRKTDNDKYRKQNRDAYLQELNKLEFEGY